MGPPNWAGLNHQGLPIAPPTTGLQSEVGLGLGSSAGRYHTFMIRCVTNNFFGKLNQSSLFLTTDTGCPFSWADIWGRYCFFLTKITP